MIIIDYIKQWKERRRRKSILKDIKKAKDIYLSHKSNFMCLCFFSVNFDKYWDSGEIQKRIPEFNREFLESKTPNGCVVWWDIDDRNSRIKAFDKLIEIYSRN